MPSIATILYSFFTAYFLLTLTLYVLSWTLSPKNARLPSFFARALAFFATLMASATYGFTASMVLRCFGKAGLTQWTTARAFKWSMWLTTGVYFDIVEGQQYLNTRPAVFLGNHQSFVIHLSYCRKERRNANNLRCLTQRTRYSAPRCYFPTLLLRVG
jgi:lysophosphatidate acyltransferase